MFKLLFKKQLTEIFRSYFFDAKKGRMRSKKQIILYFFLFFILMAGVLGGMFTSLAFSLCPTLMGNGLAWLYFLIMSGVAIFLGAFGSIFNTFSSLYLAKDNDFLLSLPIPEKYIIASRLTTVYFLGSIYSLTALIPTIIVYWIISGISLGRVIGALALILIITSLVLILSCLLGWCVAKLSQKIKGKSFTTVLFSIIFIIIYYFFFYRAEAFINDLLANSFIYGTQLDTSAHFLTLFGRIGTGDLLSALLFLAFTFTALILTWLLLKNTFLGIITGRKSKNIRPDSTVLVSENVQRPHSPFSALVHKELRKFLSDSTYMLNCGLGILFLPAFGIIILTKSPEILTQDITGGIIAIIACIILITLTAMIDVAAPSISLEGKNLWLPQSLPVSTEKILLSKAALQFILTIFSVIFTSVCIIISFRLNLLMSILLLLLICIYTTFSALFNVSLGLRFPILTWTSEITPIKQSAAVLISVFGTFLIAALFAVPFFLIDISPAIYLALWVIIFSIATYLSYHWLKKKGVEIFQHL